MSWSINKIGSREGVLQAVKADSSIPQGVKMLVTEALETNCPEGAELTHQGKTWIAHDGAEVRGHGHGGFENWSGVSELVIRLFKLEPHPVIPESGRRAAPPS